MRYFALNGGFMEGERQEGDNEGSGDDKRGEGYGRCLGR